MYEFTLLILCSSFNSVTCFSVELPKHACCIYSSTSYGVWSLWAL